MALQRVDRLKSPPELGRFYLVPAIWWKWHSHENPTTATGAMWWPVIGNKHDDREFFDFPHKHYHGDPRFFHARHWQRFASWDGRTALTSALGSPLNHSTMRDGPPKPVLRRMRCRISSIAVPDDFADFKPVIDLNRAFAGKQCAKGKRGFVCPHRFTALGVVAPVDGVITCPLHGLRIDAETGKCIGPRVNCEAQAA